MITEPISIPHNCPKDMLLYPGDNAENTWVCDCRPRFLYFPSFSLNNSCHEAYRQGPCPPKNYVILPKDEAVPRCVENPCIEDGVVPYNGTCYPLTIDGPCAPYGVLGVNETTFQLECVTTNIVTRSVVEVIKAPLRTCPPGSRRSTLGSCRKVRIHNYLIQFVACSLLLISYIHFI